MGADPTTSRVTGECSTVELQPQVRKKMKEPILSFFPNAVAEGLAYSRKRGKPKESKLSFGFRAQRLKALAYCRGLLAVDDSTKYPLKKRAPALSELSPSKPCSDGTIKKDGCRIFTLAKIFQRT